MVWDWNVEKRKKWLKPAPGMDQLAARWKKLNFQTLLDRGCGPGRHAIYFAKAGFSVTGMDLSQEALDYLDEWAQQENVNIFTVRGDMFRMPFQDDSFDCVIDYNVSYHTNTTGYFQAVRELYRVLRPGGEVYLTLKSRSDPVFQKAKKEDHIDRFTLLQEGKTPHFFADESDLQEIFQGFSLVVPAREVRAPGIDNPVESVHYHLLFRKEETLIC